MDLEQQIVTYITLNLISLNVQILYETVLDRAINTHLTKYTEHKF